MKIPTLYLDTSVIGGCFDDEFKAATRELFRQADLGLYQLFVSVAPKEKFKVLRPKSKNSSPKLSLMPNKSCL